MYIDRQGGKIMKKISIVIVVAFLAVAGTLAITNNNSTQAEIGPNTITVKGSVTYPSSEIPDSTAVCALNLSTKHKRNPKLRRIH